MEKNYNYTEIESYVKEELKGADLAAFEEKLSMNSELGKEVDFYKQIAEVTTLKGLFEEAELELVTEEKEKTEVSTTQKKEAKTFSLSRRILAMASSFLVLVFAGWWLFSTNLNTSSGEYLALANDNFIHYPSLASRGDEANPSLYNNYKNKDYKEAAIELEQYATTNKDATAQLYAAISYLALNQPQKAIDLLSEVEGVESLNNRKFYYLGLAQLQLGQKENAITAFKQVNDIDAFLFKRATTILETLKK